MKKPWFFTFLVVLCYFHILTVGATNTPQQTLKNNPFLLPSQLLALKPSAKTPQKERKKFSDLLAPSTASPQREEAEKQRDLIEEMVIQGAWIRSAVVPAWGQIYNEHYWKVPVIYVAFAGLAWGGIYNHQEYIKAKNKLIQGDRYVYSMNYVNDCRRNRDICIIFAVLWYVANIFDAYVGASLKTFNLSKDISLEIQPHTAPVVQHRSEKGLSLSFKF